MWPVLRGEKPFEYDELLINKDPIYSTAALRKGDWKLIQGRREDSNILLVARLEAESAFLYLYRAHVPRCVG